MQEKEIYEKAVETFGKGNQLDMVMEKCAGLIQAVNKFKHDANCGTVMSLAIEIAEVETMLEQLIIIVESVKPNFEGVGFKNSVEEFKKLKLSHIAYWVKHSDEIAKYSNQIK